MWQKQISTPLDCEQSLFSQSSLSSAGLERANKLGRGGKKRGSPSKSPPPFPPPPHFPSTFARFARFPSSRDHPDGLLAVYNSLKQTDTLMKLE